MDELEDHKECCWCHKVFDEVDETTRDLDGNLYHWGCYEHVRGFTDDAGHF